MEFLREIKITIRIEFEMASASRAHGGQYFDNAKRLLILAKTRVERGFVK
jgi:hypothetical protein